MANSEKCGIVLTKSAKGILVKQLILPFIQEQFPLRFLKAGTARPERRDQLRKLELASNRVHMLFIGSRDVHWSIATLCILYATKHTSHSNHSSSISPSEIELSPLLNSASDYSDGRRYSFGRILYGIFDPNLAKLGPEPSQSFTNIKSCRLFPHFHK
jgi:hypothetical protein